MHARIFVIAMVASLSLFTPAQDASQQDAISKIRTLENLWNQAEAKHDARALDLILDSAMIYIDEGGGLLSKAQFLNRFAQENGTDFQWLVISTMDVRLYGDTAVVVGTYRVKSSRWGKQREWTGRFIDTWAFKDGVWLCVAAQATPMVH